MTSMRDFKAHLRRTAFNEPMVYARGESDARLNGWSAAPDGLQLGRGRRGSGGLREDDAQSYRRRSMEFLESIKSDRNRRFREFGAMALTPRSSAGVAALLSPRTFAPKGHNPSGPGQLKFRRSDLEEGTSLKDDFKANEQVGTHAPGTFAPGTNDTGNNGDRTTTNGTTADKTDSEVNIADVATAAAAAVLADRAASSEGIGGPESNPSTARPLLSAPPPISVSGDPVKDKLINELLKKGASEDMLYQVLLRYDAAKARKMQSARGQGLNSRKQSQQHLQHTLELGGTLASTSSTSASASTTANINDENRNAGEIDTGIRTNGPKNNHVVLRRIRNAKPIGPATEDVFNFDSLSSEHVPQRKHFEPRRKMTGLIGMDDISPRSQKKHVSPRQFVNGGAGTRFDWFNESFHGGMDTGTRSRLEESRPNRKRMLDNGLFDTTGDLCGSWTDMRDYREEPARRPSRKKSSPRESDNFGKTRALDGEYGSTATGVRQLQAGYPEVKGNRNFDGPEKRKDRGQGGDGFRGRFARAQRMMSQSMDQWQITSAR